MNDAHKPFSEPRDVEMRAGNVPHRPFFLGRYGRQLGRNEVRPMPPGCNTPCVCAQISYRTAWNLDRITSNSR